MARSISSSSRKEVITDVVTTTLQKTTSRLIPAHSNAFFVSDFHRTSRVGQACNKLLDRRRGAVRVDTQGEASRGSSPFCLVTHDATADVQDGHCPVPTGLAS